MRDKRFIAEHRGGTLKKEQHRQLMKWAIACAEHVLALSGTGMDIRLADALLIAKEWVNDRVPVGDAMKASVASHAAAREAAGPVAIAVARAVGQAVATAHMADHSLGAALYALKAVNSAGQSADEERKWQQEQLPPEIMELVLSARREKEQHFK